MTSTTYPVTGMSCEHCVHAVAGELSALDGVSQVSVTGQDRSRYHLIQEGTMFR